MLEKRCIWGHVSLFDLGHFYQNSSKHLIHSSKNFRPKIRQENGNWRKPTSSSRFRKRRRSSSTTSIDLWPFQTIVHRIQCILWNTKRFSIFQYFLTDYLDLRFVMLCYHSSFRVDFRWIKRAHQIGFHGCPQKSGNFKKQGSDNQVHGHVMIWAWFYPSVGGILSLSLLQRSAEARLFEFLR